MEWQSNLKETVVACCRVLYRNSPGSKRNAVGTCDEGSLSRPTSALSIQSCWDRWLWNWENIFRWIQLGSHNKL